MIKRLWNWHVGKLDSPSYYAVSGIILAIVVVVIAVILGLIIA